MKHADGILVGEPKKSDGILIGEYLSAPNSQNLSLCQPAEQLDNVPKWMNLSAPQPRKMFPASHPVCFLCGHSRLPMKVHILRAWPVRHKLPSSETLPFFPFLEDLKPAVGSKSISREGTVVSCYICFHSLLKQWIEFERKSASDGERWIRKYTLDFICYVCAGHSLRENVRVLPLYKFPFLKDHNYPPESLLLDQDSDVVVCRTCATSLSQQFQEYERMCVPESLRLYILGNSEDAESTANSFDARSYEVIFMALE